MVLIRLTAATTSLITLLYESLHEREIWIFRLTCVRCFITCALKRYTDRNIKQSTFDWQSVASVRYVLIVLCLILIISLEETDSADTQFSLISICWRLCLSAPPPSVSSLLCSVVWVEDVLQRRRGVGFSAVFLISSLISRSLLSSPPSSSTLPSSRLSPVPSRVRTAHSRDAHK